MRTLNASLTILALAGSLVALSGCDGEEANAKKTDEVHKVRVTTTQVERIPFEEWGSYSANLRGAEDVMLMAPGPAGGQVKWILDVGAKVKKGQALCDIDSDRYGAQLSQAKAALDLTKGEMERAKANVESGSLGKAVLDKATLDYEGARVAYFQALSAYEQSRCEAPFAGMLVSRGVERYQTAAPAPGLYTVRVARIDRVEAVLSIPETEAQGYKSGSTAVFHLIQEPDQVYEGTLRSIDMAADQHTRTMTARLEIPNPNGNLLPGMIGRARVLRSSYDSAVVVPSTALLRLQEGAVVMIADEGVARKVPVVTGASQRDSVLIMSGLKPGQTLITHGAFQVSEGTPIEY